MYIKNTENSKKSNKKIDPKMAQPPPCQTTVHCYGHQPLPLLIYCALYNRTQMQTASYVLHKSCQCICRSQLLLLHSVHCSAETPSTQHHHLELGVIGVYCARSVKHEDYYILGNHFPASFRMSSKWEQI